MPSRLLLVFDVADRNSQLGYGAALVDMSRGQKVRRAPRLSYWPISPPQANRLGRLPECRPNLFYDGVRSLEAMQLMPGAVEAGDH
jgi:hypothetical protein